MTTCNRKCNPSVLESGDSMHYLDCTVWPWVHNPTLVAIPGGDPLAQRPTSGPEPTRHRSLYRFADIVSAACVSGFLVAGILLLFAWFEVI